MKRRKWLLILLSAGLFLSAACAAKGACPPNQYASIQQKLIRDEALSTDEQATVNRLRNSLGGQSKQALDPGK